MSPAQRASYRALQAKGFWRPGCHGPGDCGAAFALCKETPDEMPAPLLNELVRCALSPPKGDRVSGREFMLPPVFTAWQHASRFHC